MKTKINEEISLDRELWTMVRKKTKEIKDRISSKEIEGTITKIRRQGSVATRTIINPMISRGKNELDLDIGIVLKRESIENGNITLMTLISQMEEIFPNQKFKFKSKAIATTFVLQHEGEDIHLGIDIVFLAIDEKENMYVWNSKDNKYEISDPFGLIDKFRLAARNDEELVYTNKLIKSLRDKQSVKGLKSIFILNASLKAKDSSLKSVVDILIEDAKSLKDNRYVISVANSNDKITRPDDFDYAKVYGFLNSIKDYDEDDIETILGISSNSIGLKKGVAITAAATFGKVHND